MRRKVKVLIHNPSSAIVEKESHIGRLQLSSEIKRRLAGDSKIGFGIYRAVKSKAKPYDKEITTMAFKTSKQEAKRLSKGQRTYIRRLKQATRKGTVPNSPHSTPAHANTNTQEGSRTNPKETVD